MKHKLAITFTIITLIITTTCKSNFGENSELEKALKKAKYAKQEALKILKTQTTSTDNELNRQKKLIIAMLKNKTTRAKYTLKIHKNDIWRENNDPYGMNEQGQAFHVAKNSDNDEIYSSDRNKTARKLIYLAFEHRLPAITNFGKILNKLAESADTNTNHAPNEYDIKTEYNIFIENILSEAKKYAHNYFEFALIPLYEKQDKLSSLSLETLNNLKDKFDELQKIRDTCKMYAETIYNDFKNDKDQIKSNAAKLKNYISQNYKQKFLNSFAKTETLANEIKEILDTI
ncbi:virulence associated lipoprotein (plasmid) [Borrelia puertoricensis]|uniref:virulence associated lipoprotein n=1 Tax=Borrelia puertoricensis TaxID=2756107 RepID=UPI003EBE9102